MLSAAVGQTLPPLPAPQAVPKPGPVTDAPYAPQAIMPGGVVIPLYPPGSAFLRAGRVKEAEIYNMSGAVPGRINSIVNIHNPSIEFHPVERGLNTGAVVILVAGGGHNTLNVGNESVDEAAFFANYGVNSVILRNRLRKDGYVAEVDAVNDAQQAVRMVRAYAKQWNLDPNKIGMMGFSAGAELVSPAAVLYEEFDKKNNGPGDPFAGISSRPDFVGIIYPGPTPFAKNRTAPAIPKTAPPSFLVCAGSGDKVHAVWAVEYFNAMLALNVPNLEMHIYGTGRHGGALTDRGDSPFGTWQFRFIDWFRDLGFLQKSGVETRAAQESKAFASAPASQPAK
jgi:acetyl esterase/lipase